MSTKRARSNSNSLTGGTNDVNPQWLVARNNIASTGTDSTTLTNIPLPNNKIVQPYSGKPVICEILKVHFWLFPAHSVPIANPAGANQHVDNAIDLALTYGTPFATSSTVDTIDFGNSLVITALAVQTHQRVVSSSALSPANMDEFDRTIQPYVIDLTDGAGHGLLCATDTIGFYLGLSQPSAGNYFSTVRMLFRYKAVGLEEYVTMLQSQQTRTG